MATTIADTARIYSNVVLGKNVVIEDFCLIGIPGGSDTPGKTVIGDNSVIRAGTYIYAGNRIGANFQTGNKANIREDNRIGDNVSVGTLSVVEHHVTIGDGVRIHSQAFIPEYTTLEEGCWIGPNVVITNAPYPQSPNVKQELKGATIQAKAKVGANVTLLPGVELGAGCLVGAGSVVTKDIPERMIAAGNPAVILRKIDY
jgi:acetyltransferase-like isoleucine patch superfamily enzyme